MIRRTDGAVQVRACVRWLGLPVLAQTVDGHDHCGYNDDECCGERGDPDVAGSDVRTGDENVLTSGHLRNHTKHTYRSEVDDQCDKLACT